MPKDYRVYVIGPDGHILKRIDVWCVDDQSAKDRARQMVDGHDIELWHRDRKLAVFEQTSDPRT